MSTKDSLVSGCKKMITICDMLHLMERLGDRFVDRFEYGRHAAESGTGGLRLLQLGWTSTCTQKAWCRIYCQKVPASLNLQSLWPFEGFNLWRLWSTLLDMPFYDRVVWGMPSIARTLLLISLCICSSRKPKSRESRWGYLPAYKISSFPITICMWSPLLHKRLTAMFK